MTNKGLLERMEYAEAHHDRVRVTLNELRVLLSGQGEAAQLRDELARKAALIAQLEDECERLRTDVDAAMPIVEFLARHPCEAPTVIARDATYTTPELCGICVSCRARTWLEGQEDD